jgi:hypothetical protein
MSRRNAFPMGKRQRQLRKIAGASTAALRIDELLKPKGNATHGTSSTREEISEDHQQARRQARDETSEGPGEGHD